jgi:hypothetical protein
MSSAPLDQAIPHVRWPLERVLFALAGSVTLISAALSAFVSPWFLLLTALVGANQWLYVLLGACPASIVLRRLFSLPSVVYPPARACPLGAERASNSAAAASVDAP